MPILKYAPFFLLLGVGQPLTAATPQGALPTPPGQHEAAPALRTLQDADERVARISYRLLVKGAELCPLKQAISGFSIHHITQYRKKDQAAAAVSFGLGDHPIVLTVAEGSAAERVGLRPGDAILAVNGAETQTLFESRTEHSYAGVQKFEAMLEEAMAQGPVELRYGRDKEQRVVALEPEYGCRSRVQVVPTRALRGRADGVYVQVSTGLVDFARDDDSLALWIAHEIAHNIFEHRKHLNGVPRGLLGMVGKNAARIRATELEADYVALYMMALAGYDISKTPEFWRKLGKRSGGWLSSSPTHPSWGARSQRAEETIAEIVAKQARGERLLP